MTRQPANDEKPSKTARKREALRLQAVGARLGELPAETLARLDVPDTLRAALADYQRFPSHGARRRQLQFIGRLMRELDTDAIEAQLADIEGESARARYQFNQLEQWRDRLLDEADAVTEFIAAYPAVDRQRLRQQVKKVEQASSDAERKTQSRLLFRLLRETVGDADA